MSDTKNALIVPPKNELAVIAEKAGAKADKLGKMARYLGVGGVSGYVLAFSGALVAIHLAPVVAPVLLVTGLVGFFGSSGAAFALDPIEKKARKQSAEAVRKRIQHLKETARSALDGAIADGTIRIGLALPLAPKDENPKKLRVEDVNGIVTTKGEKTLSISARILEEDGADVDWLKGSSPAIFAQLFVAAFPEAVMESMRAALAKGQRPPAGGARDANVSVAAASLQNSLPPAIRKPEKKLPRIKLG
jgi:hypothetical protein